MLKRSLADLANHHTHFGLLAHNHLKLTYQRDSVTDLEQKHKEWAQEDTAS